MVMPLALSTLLENATFSLLVKSNAPTLAVAPTA
jgi:hypothetical protein